MTRGGVTESVSERVACARRESTSYSHAWTVPRRGRKEERQQLECSLGAGAMPPFAIFFGAEELCGELEGGGSFRQLLLMALLGSPSCARLAGAAIRLAGSLGAGRVVGSRAALFGDPGPGTACGAVCGAVPRRAPPEPGTCALLTSWPAGNVFQQWIRNFTYGLARTSGPCSA
jgi:hypothetical protein